MEHAEPTAEADVAAAPEPVAAAPGRLPVTRAAPAAHACVAGDPRGSLARLATAPPRLRGSVLGRMQQGVGNGLVARAVLARGGGGDGGAPPSNAPHGGQHGSGPTLDVGTLEDSEKIAALPEYIASGEAVTIAGLWRSHSGWPGVARTHEDLFLQSIGTCPDLLDDFTAEQESFKRSVEGRAQNHLAENRQFVMEEMAKLGLETEASFDAGTPEDQAQRLADVKALAAEAQRALRAKQDLLGIKVGLNGSAVDDGASGAPGAYDVVAFNPDAKPQMPGDASQGFRTWEEVNGQWTELEAAIAHLEATSPALFALMNGEALESDAAKAESAGELATDDDGTALAKLESALRSLQGKLDEVSDGIGSDYEWDDLGALHPQVLAAPPWTGKLDAAIAQRLVGEKTANKEALDTALTAGGLLVALLGVFATGGMATALMVAGAAASGTQAIISTDDYLTKKQLREARTGAKEHDLVGREAVDAARVKAIIDGVFAFIDVAGAAKAIRVAGAAEDVAAKARRLGELAGEEKERAFKGAMDVLGPPKALDTVGGLASARSQLGTGSAALSRAEAYSKQLVDEVGQSLGGKEAREQAAKTIGPDAVPGPPPAPKPPEQLLQEARELAAAKTGLPADRALKTVAPGADSAEQIALLVQRTASASAKASEEFAQLATKEARAARVHEQAVAWAQQRRIPAPTSDLAPNGPFFDPVKWKVVYNSEALAAKEATHAQWELMLATGVHEMRHAQQSVDMARIALGRGIDEAAIVAQGIHADGVAAAKALGPIKAGDPAFAKANAWYESVYGAGRAQRDKVLAELANHRALGRKLRAAWDEVAQAKAALQGVPPGHPDHARLAQELKDAELRASTKQANWDRGAPYRKANDDAYKALPEEADAYDVQREYEAMLQAEREAKAAKDAAGSGAPPQPQSVPDEIELDDSDIIEVLP